MAMPVVALLAASVVCTLLAVFLTRRRKKARAWHWLLLIGGPLVVVAIAGAIEISRQNAALAPFQPYLSDYLSLPGERAGDPLAQMRIARPAGDPYIRGKLMPVQVRNKTLDLLYFRLPDDLRPASPDEVGSVAWLHCTSVTRVVRRVGASTNNTVDYSCEVALVDRSAGAIVATQRFGKTSGEQGYEDVLYPQILDYLAGLPRKGP